LHRIFWSTALLLALAVAKDPKHRLPSVATFAVALGDACRGQLADDLRRQARALLRIAPWSEPEYEPITIRPGVAWAESGRQRIHTAPLPDMPVARADVFLDTDLLPPPPPVRSREDSFAA